MKRYLIPFLITILALVPVAASCGERANPDVGATPSEASPSPQHQSAVEQTAEEETENNRMELVERLQQVNDALAVNMEVIFDVTDNINRLYDGISSSMQRIAQAQSSFSDSSLMEMMGSSYRSQLQSRIDQESWNISSYKFKIAENRIKLRELQDRQLELEKERNLLLTELAKLE
jgi:hypothetical protein